MILNVTDLNTELRQMGTQFLNILHCRHNSWLPFREVYTTYMHRETGFFELHNR
jgi:hypothetical protein